jgi:hypothetical protein
MFDLLEIQDKYHNPCSLSSVRDVTVSGVAGNLVRLTALDEILTILRSFDVSLWFLINFVIYIFS